MGASLQLAAEEPWGRDDKAGLGRGWDGLVSHGEWVGDPRGGSRWTWLLCLSGLSDSQLCGLQGAHQFVSSTVLGK